MDAKELRAELTERSNDGAVKFAVQYDRSKCEPGAGAFKADTAGARPCAVIGPDRVVLPARDAPKKPTEPWLTTDPVYRRLPDYPYKMSDHKDPTRNISPRQTFQENMQRIIMPPGYNTAKLHEDPPFASKNNKLNAPLEVKYCDVPYNINQVSSEQKHIRNADHSASNVNPLLMRGIPHGWPAGSVHVRPMTTYGAPEVLQYPDYANCTGPRPVLTRTHTSTHDEQLYPDAYYQESNIRFKPYPNIKERYPQTRYEYLGNYPNPYHPPNPFTHKYELPKTIPPHPYPGYPQIPKYTERIPDPIIDGYQRTFQQGNYSVPIRNPVIHSPYRPVLGNPMQNKLHPYPPDGQHKPVPNKLPYDPASKMYIDYDTRAKPMPITDNYYLNESPRSYHPKNTIVLQNFASANVHGANAHPCYPLKNYDYPRYKNIDPSMINHSFTKLPPQFSPSTLAISPADSNASIETAQTHGTSQEDCGYASQSSVTSARSIESLNRMPMDAYGRYDYRYNPMLRVSSSSKPGPSSNQGLKTKKDIRQFISSWSEGDDENAENSTKRDSAKAIPDEKHTFNKQYETINNQEQLYVLGLVNVPSEELSKYEHIQKVSKLPENIKGYNSLELLNQFEEAIESSNITSVKPPTPRAVQMPVNRMLHKHDPVPRALSPLDVEAKISQSVIHKEVGCNFEIKPCSPKMLNVEVATPMQTLLSERVIEKVTNPHNVKSPIRLQSADENIENTLITKTMKCPVPIAASSCKMINRQHLSESPGIDNLKTNYSLQDLESNSGVCLASLPRLDNDIELNFPEVNQQFINANKTDSVITTSFVKDLPALDVDGSPITSTDYDMNYQFSPKTETETDFSRLSKYRKLKRCVPKDNNSELAKAQATRVDSVIIKNPDNTRTLEESTDNTNPGGHFRNNFQEYAMNLVSETKQKEIYQQDVDKMFGSSSSTVVTSTFDDINTHSPNRFAMNQSSNVLIKHLDVIEETSRNKTVNPQSKEDFSIHSKDPSNRYLEKAALDIPMNLSPQARYSTVGVDDEIRQSTAGDRTGTLDENRQCAVEETCLKNNEEEKPKCSSALSLDKGQNTLIKSQDENLIDVSDNHCLDTRENPITKPDIPGNFASPMFKKSNSVRIGKDDHMALHIDNHSEINDMCSDEESNATLEIKQIDGLTIEKTSIAELNRGHDIFGDKGQGESDPTAISNDKIKETIDDLHKPHNTFKKYEKYVSKLKRKKDKSEAKRRKRSFEKNSSTVVDCHDKNEQNLTMLSHIDEENSIKQSARNEPPKVLAESNIPADANLINEDIMDNVKNTNVSKLGDMAVQFEALQTSQTDNNDGNENKDSAEHITPNCPDVTKNNISLLCLPVKFKCLEKERNETALNDFPMDSDSDTTNPNADSKLAMQIDYQIVSKIPVNQTEPEKEFTLHVNSSINFKANEFDTSVLTDHLETERDAYLENKQLDTPVLSPEVTDKQKKETKADEILYFKHEKVIKMGESDQNESKNRESNVQVSMKESGDESVHCKDLQICENSQTIASKNEAHYVDIPMLNTKDNPSTTRSEYEIKAHLSEAVTNKRNNSKKVCHPLVNKELFSSRIQNLLNFNENVDICSCAGKPKIADKHLSLDEKTFDPETRDQTTYKTKATEMKSSKTITEIVELDACHSFKPNIIDEAGALSVEFNKEGVGDKTEGITIEEKCSNKGLDKEMDATTMEKITLSNNCDVNNAFGEITENEGENNIDNTSPELHSYEETQTITAVYSLKQPVEKFVTESCCEEDLNECDEDFENHNDSNNVESDTCATNIIVIDETLKMSPEECHELSEHGTSDVKGDKLIKKRQSFVQNPVNARPRFSLKRSLSDSALNAYDDDVDESTQKKCFMLPKKRKKHTDIGKIDESHLLKIIQSSRRNSVSTVNNENFSFCILIDDHCIVAEENYEQENFVQVEDDLLNHPFKEAADEKIACNLADKHENEQDIYLAKYDDEKSWVEDVGCEETIETEDIAENIVIGDPASPKDADLSEYESDDEDIDTLNNEAVDHTSKVKHIYGDNMCTNDAQLVDALYRTPQMDVNKKLMDRESHITDKCNKYYDSDTLEMLLAEPVDNIPRGTAESNIDYINCPTIQGFDTDSLKKESKDVTVLDVCSSVVNNLLLNVAISNEKNIEAINSVADAIANDKTQDKTIHSCESSLDNVFSYIHKEDSPQTTSSSPEVSSTTSEEKNSSILLKISNFKASRISEVKSLSSDKQKENSCKLGAEEYLKPNYSDGMSSNRPLRTKAAQKYIPPLRESIPDLKVKLTLPQQSLLKYQKNKVAKEEPKLSSRNIYNKNIKSKHEIPRKVKPKFEDVLKNIDEAQFQLHKEKNKKAKKYIPKVVIKKLDNGSHYASTSTKESFNPDLTGRKWQPWVFIEKNKFIDDMALKKKTRAVFSHRRKSFVLAEKFCKYKSISSAKFVISQPKINDFCTGNLKYTIKLKHSY